MLQVNARLAQRTEVRPGVWLDEGSEIHRRARVVAPAYIGCASKVRADALITRLSDIERDCCIDCGTVVEDTSVLANTTIGICLDLCHAVVSGNILLNLEREVLIEISDSRVLRSTNAGRRLARGARRTTRSNANNFSTAGNAAECRKHMAI